MDGAGFADLATGLPDAVALIDAGGTILWINRACERLFGLTPDEVVGTSALDLIHPEDLEATVVAITRVQRKEVGALNEFRLRTSAGWKRIEVIGSNLTENPSVGGIVVSMRDLTERRRWEVATDETERFRSLVHNARSVLMMLDATGRIVSTSAAVTRILGHDQELVEGSPLCDLVADYDRGRFEGALAQAGDERGAPSATVLEVDLVRRDGRGSVPFELNIVNLLDDPTVEGFVVSAHEITELRAVRDALQRLATRDSLTGLPNRSLILERVDHMLARTSRLETSSALLFIDLDHFKDVNDSLGHRVGDDVLRQVSARFVSALRGSDAVGRLGGDEFVVLAEDATSQEDVETVAERLLECLASPIPVGERPASVTMSASIGIAIGRYTSALELLADADIALYRAKATGRNRFVRFEPYMRDRENVEIEEIRTINAGFF